MATLTFHFDPNDLPGMIEAVIDSFDFTIPGDSGGTLGRDMAVRVAIGIANRSTKGEGPDGTAWTPNSPGYAAYKRERYGVGLPGELGGQMLSEPALLGKPEVTPDHILMTYGWGLKPQKTDSRNSVPLKPSELKATDREKAQWFTDGGRRFYELDQTIADSVVNDVVAPAMDKHLKAAGY
jgi:hypothetical protein